MLRCLLAFTIATLSAAELQVPYVRQYRQGCGPASVAMVVRYWANQGASVDPLMTDPRAIYRSLYNSELEGTSGAEMADFFRQLAFRAFVIYGDRGDLRTNIARGRPVIACLRLRGQPSHFVVVVGIDEATGNIRVHDPERGARRLIESKQFEKEWSTTQNWTLVAAPGKLL